MEKGETVAAIAEDLNVSPATARRFLTNLALAKAVEAGSPDKARTKGSKEVVVHTATAKGVTPKYQPSRGAGLRASPS